MSILVHDDPTAGQRITELHCWIATYADGTEGIIAGGLPGLGMTTLISSKRSAAQGLAPIANAAMAASQATSGRVVRVRLVTFTTTEGTRQ